MRRPVGEVLDLEVGLHPFAVADRRAGRGGELEVTRQEVGMAVGLDDPLDPQTVRRGVVQVGRDVPVRVDHDRPARGLVADQVRQL
jgi:hypothetical protein